MALSKLCECKCGLPAPLGKRFIIGHNGGHSTAPTGMAHTPTWWSWRSMLQRCRNLKDKHYGGRGIKVCECWKGFDGFANFLADVGERPPDKTLDRFPNNQGNYEPGNCRWATAKEQLANRRPFKRGQHEK